MVKRTPKSALAGAEEPSSWLIATFAVATGALVANLYYAQPLLAQIGPEIGISPELAGAIVSATQIGYGAGLFFLVSLSDLVENKKLVFVTLAGTILGLIGVATAASVWMFLVSYFVVGVCSTAAQIIIPFAAHLVPERRRGRVVGNIMAALLTGIMLARPVALFVAGYLGWRAVFWISAALMILIGLALARIMPRHRPRPGMHYGQILTSMIVQLKTRRVLRYRAAYQGLMFAAFNLFWTAAPLMLAGRFGLGANAIALFALAGAGGALCAPVAGHIADRGFTLSATIGAMLTLSLSFFATGWAVAAGALLVLAVLAVLLDAAVQVNQVVTQRIVFTLSSEMRGRLNAIYMTLVFVCGAGGSVLGTITYQWGGWRATALAGGLIGVLLLLLFAFEQAGLRAKTR